MTESQGHLTAQPYSDKSAIPFGLMEDQYKDLLENKDLRKISSGDFTGVGDKVKEMFSVISNDRVPEASKTIDHIVDANKMIGEFERVMISASKMYGSLVNTLLLDLANAHLLDIAAKDERVAVLEQITQHPLYEHLVKAEARIRELEGELEKRGSWGKLKNMDHKIIEFELGEDHKCGFNFFYEKTTQIWNCFLSREMMDDFCNLPSRFNGIRVS